MHIVELELELEERETERVSSSALVNKPPLSLPYIFYLLTCLLQSICLSLCVFGAA